MQIPPNGPSTTRIVWLPTIPTVCTRSTSLDGSPDYSDPDNYLSPFFRDGNFVNNGYSNKEVNDLIVKQAGEKDESARGDILKQIQKLETEDLSTIPLLQGAQVAVTGTSVKGVTLDASFRFRYASVTKG